jgi:acyl transferase domain-containing protein/NAD(P)-dependent dehydrogenase (short-subunit alcohol dehydrogenase family)/acyl-CoA thioesterase FadM/acyl carrier protein
MSSNGSKRSIAVIGLACWYPGASTPLQFWENSLARRRQFRQIPDCRLPLSDYYHPDPSFPDKTYGRRAALIDGFEFDWASMRIPFTTFKATDISHWLALKTAIAAIADAGYTRETIPDQRTGVIVGNTLTGEQTRSNTLRMRWPYFKRSFEQIAKDQGLPADRIEGLSVALEHRFKSVFPPVTEDTLAGGLSNTISGRICNYYNLIGGGYAIDGACASSLLAVANAAARLTEKDLDLAIVGGVDISLDPFELIGFAKTGALTKGDMTVYDRRGSGFIPGEGCGFVVLKRLKDAKKDKDEIYAILHGWGISSDGGNAGITAPSAKGQAQAIKRAYKKAPYGMKELNFIEGHGTGTAVGDRTELEGISLAMQAFGKIQERNCGITSLKSLIGHTKAASGIGGLIKAIIAVNRRVIPPTASCRLPHPAFDNQAKVLYPVRYGIKQDEPKALRAGVSAMGFGGINCHVTLSSADPPSLKFASDLAEETLMVSDQDSEIFVLSANTPAELEKHIQENMTFSEEISLAEMTDLAADLAKQSDRFHPIRAAVVADSPDVLQKRWEELLKILNESRLIDGNPFYQSNSNQMVWLSYNSGKPKIGFLFPGQGSQQLNMGATLAKRFNWARELIERAAEKSKEVSDIDLTQLIYRPIERAKDRKEIDTWSKELAQTEVAQPAICLVSLLWLRLLDKLGVRPIAVGGHSLGEVTAFAAAGAFDENTLLHFSTLRGQAMAHNGSKGAMVSLKCPRERAETLIQNISDYLILANINSPTQMVLSGETAAIDMVAQLASAEGIITHRLNVSTGFHSLLAAPAADIILRQKILPNRLKKLNYRLFSSIDGREITPGLSLVSHFSEQLKSQVNFIDMIHAMSNVCDFFLEVGPGKVLTGLVRDIQNENAASCLPLAPTPEGDIDLNRALAALYIHGADIQWSLLYNKRLIRPFLPPSKRLFIENPCEHVPAELSITRSSAAMNMDQILTDLAQIPMEELQNYLSKRGSFIAQVISADMNYSWPKGTVLPMSGPPSKPSVPEPKVTDDISTKPQKTSTPSDQIENNLYELIAKITGFDRDSISSDARLLDDLNLDSIKAGDLLVKLAQKCGFSWPGDPNIMANASIEQIVTAAARIYREAKEPISASSNQVEIAPPQLFNEAQTTRLLLSIVTEITGYPEESFTLDARLTDDLNLDSIKINDLIARIAHTLNLNPNLKMEKIAQGTLNDLLNAFLGYKKQLPGPITAPAALKSPLDIVTEQAARITGYGLSSIDPDALVERDLNMSQEMLKELLQRSAALLGTQSHVDLSPLRSRSLRQIAQILERIGQREKVEPLLPLKKAFMELLIQRPDAWVRNFELIPTIEPLPPLPKHWGKRQEDDWQTASVLILHREDNAEVADTLADQLFEQGAQIKTTTFNQAREKHMADDPGFSHLVAVLPRNDISASSASDYLKEAIIQISSLTAVTSAALAPRLRTTLAFVTFGGGYFGMNARFANIIRCCGRAVGATLHLERTDLRVRVIDFSTAIEPIKIAEAVLAEIHSPPAFTAAGYDFEMKRRTVQPVLSQPINYPSRSIKWSSEDVLLVTGGAKGITSACALAVARATGVRTALVGRSLHPDDRPESSSSKEILKKLEHYANHGLIARYFSCDVTDPSAVKKTTASIETELGPITGVIHGAGLNIPRLARQVSPEKAFEEVAPKVLGILHLHEILAKSPPKLIIGLSSIIAHTGMPGNAWYGFSNEALEVLLRNFSNDHPKTQTMAVAYSIWGEEGMGARMGSVTHLAKMGIQAIDTQKGVERFIQSFLHKPPSPSLVVTSRLGGLDTWRHSSSPKKLRHRFLTTPISTLPGIESIFKAGLSLSTDSYLKDHQFQGSYLFPTVFGLEAMAQVAVHTAGLTRPRKIRIEDIQLERPITVDPNNGADILIHGVVEEKRPKETEIVVSTGIIKLNTGVESDYFSARFIFDLKEHAPATASLTASTQTPIVPQTDLYCESLLFQGRRFQRIEVIHDLVQEEPYKGRALFSTRMAPESENLALAFGSKNQGDLILGDPFFRDTLLQSAALLVPQDTSLPIYIKCLEIFVPQTDITQSILSRIQLIQREEKDLVNQVIAVDKEGRVIEKLQDYRLRILTHHEDFPTVQDLIDPTNRDRLKINEKMTYWAEYYKGLLPLLEIAYHPGIHTLTKKERHVIELPFIKKTAGRLQKWGITLPEPIEIKWRRSGQPVLNMDKSQVSLSVSHDERLCIFAAGIGPTACDIAPVTNRSRMTWHHLLGQTRDHTIDALLQIDDTLDQAGTRLWAVGEVLRKLGEDSQAQLEILQHKENTILFKAIVSFGIQLILTMPVKLTWGPEKILALTFNQKPEKVAETESTSVYRHIYGDLGEKRTYDMLPDGPQGQMVFVQRRPLTFKPNAQLSRTTYFSNYIFWMGEVREASVWPIMSSIREQLSTGKWGSVTNYSHIKIVGEASVDDMVETRMWASDNSGPEDSTMTLSYDFRKIGATGDIYRLAFCRLQTTWVEIVGQGIAKARPYPPYLKEFLDTMLPRYEAPDVPLKLSEPLKGLFRNRTDELIYQAQEAPVVVPLLSENVFETSLSHANMVGNIYYATYYEWKGQTRDRFFYNLIPDYYHGVGEKGEMICIESRVDHLREAMPFDRILVRMALKTLRRFSMVLQFDFFRLNPDNSSTKLAHGMHRAAWVTRDNLGEPIATAWPETLLYALKQNIAQSRT